jgi:IS1 family transposase
MNRLPLQTRARIIGLLVEGNSLRAISRLCDVSINTVTKLLVDIGEAAMKYHDERVRGVKARRVQCDEIWAFVGAKKKNATPEQKAQGWGDVWTWTAIDADTKLCVGYCVGNRDANTEWDFVSDLAERVTNRFQLTTDSNRLYLDCVEGAFGMQIDYAMLQKIYGAPSDADQRRYSPATCIGCDMKVVTGNPDPKHVSTSYVERANLTMRMGMRRFTRLTNAFSKKVDNHAYAVALHFIHYNFARIHKTLRITPAMAAGISDHVWSLEEIALLAN